MSYYLSNVGRSIFAVLGAILSLGAPLGWLALQWMGGVAPTTVIDDEPLLMVYLILPTMCVFVVTGYMIGAQWEKLNAANKRLEALATRDGLTGLFNTRRFWEDIETECDRSRRHGHSLFVLLIDLDHFKKINDTYGHLVGDEVLTTLAKLMSGQLRSEEKLYRVGGEEFAVILTDLTRTKAEEVAQRLRRAVEAHRFSTSVDDDQSSIGVTISIGVSGRPCQSDSECVELYAEADKALYDAKEAGRNAVVVY